MGLGPRQENKEQQLLLSCSLHELLIMNMELMEIDSLVSKQTAILIDLHFPFFVGLCQARIDQPPHASPRMRFLSLADNGRLTAPIPDFNVA